jgi:hypothetical protein
VTPDIVSVFDSGIGQGYGAATVYLGFPNSRDRYTQRASLSYVTGSHNFKTGFQNVLPITSTNYQANGNMNYTFRNGVPILDHPARDAVHGHVEDEVRPGAVRAGPVDDQSAADAEPRPPDRHVQRLHA